MHQHIRKTRAIIHKSVPDPSKRQEPWVKDIWFYLMKPTCLQTRPQGWRYCTCRPWSLGCWPKCVDVDHKICSGQNRRESERATRDEEAAQTSEGSIGYLNGRHSLCVPDLQEDLPLADYALQTQSPLQLDHGMTTKAQTHCFPRQKDANSLLLQIGGVWF